MKKFQIPNEFLRGSEIGAILRSIADRVRLLQAVRDAFRKCVVSSAETGKPILDPFQLTRALNSTYADAAAALPSPEPTYASLRQWASAEELKAIATFETKLRAFCEKESYKLEGRYPTYLIDDFLQIKAHDRDKETEVGGHIVASLLPDTLAPAIKEAVASERARKFDRFEFIESLFQAYDRCLLLQKGSFGDPVPVRKVYQEMIIVRQPKPFLNFGKKSLFREYTMESFARDLAKALSAGPCQAKSGAWLSDRPTSFAPEGIPIIQGGQARIVGKLVFAERRD